MNVRRCLSCSYRRRWWSENRNIVLIFLTYLLEEQFDSCLFTSGISRFSNSLEFYHTAHSCEMFLSLSCRRSVHVVEYSKCKLAQPKQDVVHGKFNMISIWYPHKVKHMEYFNNKKMYLSCINTNFLLCRKNPWTTWHHDEDCDCYVNVHTALNKAWKVYLHYSLLFLYFMFIHFWSC